MLALIADTETTALVPNRTLRLDKQPEIIEFYGVMVDLRTGEQFEEIDVLIKPKTPVDETSKAFKKVQITNAMLADKPAFSHYAADIRSLIERAPLFITHNVSFDTDVIEIEYERLGEKINWPPRLCTVEQTCHLKGFPLKLSNLHEHLFGTKFEGAHRAKVDVQALARCCVKLHEMGEL